MFSLKHFQLLSRACYRQFADDGCLTSAAALSFTTLLGIVPVLGVSFYWFRIFFTEPQHQQKILDFITAVLPPEYGTRLFEELVTLAMNANKLNIIGLLSLILIVIAGLNTIDHTLNRIWKIRRSRRSIYKMLLYFLVLLSVPVLIGVSLYLTSYVTALPLLSDVSEQIRLSIFSKYVGPALVSFVGFVILNVWFPNINVRIKYAIVASLLVSMLFELSKWLLLFYFGHVPTYNIIYGALASVPIFCLWMYISWAVVLLGAILTYQLQSKVYLQND